MIFAFFSDDRSGLHAAVLAARGLAGVERPVAVVRPERHRKGDCMVLHLPRTGRDASRPGGPLGTARAEAGAGRDVLLVLPLSLLRDPAVRACADLCVVPTGTTFLGAAAAGAALARLGGPCQDGEAGGPVWLLPCSGLPGLRLPEPPAWRTLPLALPRLDHSDASALLDGRADAGLVRQGVALAASLEAAAADPGAATVGPGDMAAMIAAHGTDRERRLAERLSALARLHADLQDVTPAPASASRRSVPVDARSPAMRRAQPRPTGCFVRTGARDRVAAPARSARSPTR